MKLPLPSPSVPFQHPSPQPLPASVDCALYVYAICMGFEGFAVKVPHPLVKVVRLVHPTGSSVPLRKHAEAS